MTNEQIEALKREINSIDFLALSNPEKKQTISDHIIDYLQSQKRLLADGEVGVPREPTREMIKSGWDRYRDDFYSSGKFRPKETYEAMITAAQTEKREGE